MAPRLLSKIALSLGLCALPLAVWAQEAAFVAQPGQIDVDLRGQMDFRNLAFRDCLDQPECAVGGVVIAAERQVGPGVWEPARLYWDPIDGFGVLGGQQNDEIDVDERLVVRLPEPRVVGGVWLSDLFIGEGARYQGWPESDEDVELADIDLWQTATHQGRVRVTGVFELPDDPFNAAVAEMFVEDGDLLNRVIVQGPELSVLMPDEEKQRGVVRPLTRIDVAQTTSAEDEALVAALLNDPEKIRAFDDGRENAATLLEIRKEMQRLSDIQQSAEARRTVGDLSNGELGWTPQDRLIADRLVFGAGYQTSSDYSVAGIVLQEVAP
ncbi:hypothetical protein [Tropicibacter naphthalenivorans]|uniref:Uncharacterized protein n=1 Tax=Tropicibacter naphthalenivorans TaxID=441103 RepID=A0A0P1GZL2_9RHOB|nr:hypothetical protein [Tropicibacter naphthalenivorans]CUH82683.1 hypothetical protein TRN7648_04226 [Tropicibacter naphthalenivorans]SMD11152.1 hypothetical protein SAMN04488093_1257 [Tropicibacter naphthalenivorans]